MPTCECLFGRDRGEGTPNNAPKKFDHAPQMCNDAAQERNLFRQIKLSFAKRATCGIRGAW